MLTRIFVTVECCIHNAFDKIIKLNLCITYTFTLENCMRFINQTTNFTLPGPWPNKVLIIRSILEISTSDWLQVLTPEENGRWRMDQESGWLNNGQCWDVMHLILIQFVHIWFSVPAFKMHYTSKLLGLLLETTAAFNTKIAIGCPDQHTTSNSKYTGSKCPPHYTNGCKRNPQMQVSAPTRTHL